MINLANKKKKVLSNKKSVASTDNTIKQVKTKPIKKNKRRIKGIVFFLTYLVLLSGIISIGGYLIHNNSFSYNNSSFNPDANLNNWNTYYDNHKKNHSLINLDSMTKYFKDKSINISITDPDQKAKNLNLGNFINQMDGQLIKASLEANSISADNDLVLPNNFFQNVIYNPEVNFMIDDNGKQVSAETFNYQMSGIYGATQNYALKMNISKDANNLGIKVNQDTTITINIVITNNVVFDLNNLNIDFGSTIISMEAGKTTVAKMWASNPTIQQDIEKKFVTELSNHVSTTITPDSYQFSLDQPDALVDFDNQGQGADVKFSFSATDKAKAIGFIGALKNQPIHITNTQIDLNSLGELRKKIMNKYKDNFIPVNVKNDANNDDTNLSQVQIDNINKHINTIIKDITQEYFLEKYPALNVSPDDYTITSDLNEGNDIFNQTKGLKSNLTITATHASTKFKKDSQLTQISVVIRGTNKSSTAQEWTLPTDFANNFEGIWLPTDTTNHALQNGKHYYSQNGQSSPNCSDSLYQELISNKPGGKMSLLDDIKANSYSPLYAENFTGTFTLTGQLDGYDWPKPTSITLDVAKISNSNKNIKNFFDLLQNTKSISLYTEVTKKDTGRFFNNAAINFYDNLGNDANDLLYSFDLSSSFNITDGIAISSEAKFTFTSFAADIKYNRWN